MAVTFRLLPNPFWYLSNLDGTPFAGSMFTTQSANPNVPKSIFQDSGGTIPWENPLNWDANGLSPVVNTNLFFWADDAPYDIFFYDQPNAQGNLIYTISNFSPSLTGGGSGPAPVVTNAFLENFLNNNVFYHNIGPNNNVGSSVSNGTVLAPGNHVGFVQNLQPNASPPITSASDITYVKAGGAGSIDLIAFSSQDFQAGSNPLTGDVTPEVYLRWECTVAGSETVKAVQFPITLHAKNLETQTVSLLVWLKNPNGTSLNVSGSIVQYFGTGAASTPVSTSITLSNATPVPNAWTLCAGSVSIPSTLGKSLGAGADDAVFLQINFPTGTTGVIYVAKPKLYLGTITTVFPESQYYDYVYRVINTPRTGDVRLSMNTFSPFGWVSMNDGTIGSASSNATTRANVDTWPLYNMLWPLANTACPSFTSSGAITARGASAIQDFSNNVALALPKMLGRALAGANPSNLGVTKFFTGGKDTSTNLLLKCK